MEALAGVRLHSAFFSQNLFIPVCRQSQFGFFFDPDVCHSNSGFTIVSVYNDNVSHMYVLKAADIIVGSAAFRKTDADQTVFRSGRLLLGTAADPERFTSDPGCELIVVVEIISVFNAVPFDAVVADSLRVVPEPDADASEGGYGSFDGPFTDPYLGKSDQNKLRSPAGSGRETGALQRPAAVIIQFSGQETPVTVLGKIRQKDREGIFKIIPEIVVREFFFCLLQGLL